jgi:hypothetical protein
MPLSLCPQILFDNRKVSNVRNDCLLSVDGTNFRIAMGYSKPFWSYKFNRGGLPYEVGLCIKTGDICWWSELNAPRKWNDLTIFRDSLHLILEPREQCKTDRGYQGSAPTHTKCPGVLWADPDTTEKNIHGFGAGRRLSTSSTRIGLFYGPRTSQLVGKPGSFWCYCHSHPAFFCGERFVSSSI